MQEHGVLDLLAAVCAEARRDECRGSDDVVRREGRRRDALRAVPGVDAGRVAVDDREEPLPGRSLGAQRIELVREECLGLRAGDECSPGEGQGERVETRHVERGGPRRTADELEQKPAICRGDPAGAECDVGLGLARDVSDTEAVPHDRHAGARPLSLPGLVRPEPEPSRLEEAPRSRWVTAPRSWCQPVVELLLVGRVPVERQASVLSRRKNAPGRRRRRIVALRRRCLERREHQREHADDEPRTTAAACRRTRRSVPEPEVPLTGPKVQSSDRGSCPGIRRDARIHAALGGAHPPLSRAAQAGAAGVGSCARRLRRRRRSARLGCRRRAGARRRSASTTSGGALLTAPLLGAGSLLLVGRRWAGLVALVYTGLAIGVALAVPLETSIAGTDVPDAQDVLDLWPARVLAIAGNTLGTLAVVVVALATHSPPAARECPHPRRRGSRRARQRARRARSGRARADPRGRRGSSLRRIRAPYSSSLNRAGPSSRPERRSRSQTATRTETTVRTTSDSTSAPASPP